MAPARVRRSRNTQTVLASGTRSDRPNPKQCMKERRSLIKYSVRSSERLFRIWMTRVLNISTGSNADACLCSRLNTSSALSRSARNTAKSTARENASSWSPNPLNRASRSSTSKKPVCFIFHLLQLTQEKWNHRERARNQRVFRTF